MSRLNAERDHVVRELHDLAAHAVAEIAVQAATLDAGGSGAPAVAAIRRAAGSAMRDLRRVDTLLAAAPPYGPQPDLDALERLLDDVRDRGLARSVVLDGPGGPIPPSLALAGHRVLEHLVASLAPLDHLEVCAAPHLLTIDARAAADAPLDLAAERARLHGGTLVRTADGCRVRIPRGD